VINFVVNIFTSKLLTKHRKTRYTFSLTLSRYNQTLKNLFLPTHFHTSHFPLPIFLPLPWIQTRKS